MKDAMPFEKETLKKKHLRKDLNELESLSKTMEKISMSVPLSNRTIEKDIKSTLPCIFVSNYDQK